MDEGFFRQRRALLSMAGVTTAGWLLPGCSGDDGALPQAQVDAFQGVLERNRALFKFPGAQAGVWTRAGAWVGTTGTAAPGGGRAPARDDHTRIGSITKTFTVAALLRLADQQLLSLDDVIEKYIPGLPNGTTATLRMMASMTSGIPSYSFDPAFLAAFSSDPQRVFTPQQLLDYVRGKKQDFTAGTRVEYSNSNTVALGLVVEQVARKPFAQALQELILTPLGLSQTFYPSANELPAPYLEGITVQADPDGVIKNATHWNPSWGSTAGAMISTLDDLRRWARALGTGEGLFSPQMQRQREASMNSTVPPNSPARAYALGFGVFNGWIGHTGELPGYNTSILYDPRTDTTVVSMVNSDIPILDAAGKEIAPAPQISQEIVSALAD